ncbi:hypothetical protein ACLUWI_03655 [Limosilactobacillus mucosae]|uniref:hypothetical protein n=1 Tax=Limosilactobacillus mucosae TaxID=97478 RepID=UPI003994294E
MRFNRKFYKDVFFWGGVLIFLSAILYQGSWSTWFGYFDVFLIGFGLVLAAMTMVSRSAPKNKQSR